MKWYTLCLEKLLATSCEFQNKKLNIKVGSNCIVCLYCQHSLLSSFQLYVLQEKYVALMGVWASYRRTSSKNLVNYKNVTV